MFIRVFLIFLEVLIITVMNYYMATSYYSLDVLYCLPVIQTASFSALQVQRSSDTQVFVDSRHFLCPGLERCRSGSYMAEFPP